ncbi:hypothetical protein, partial [Candidatus Frankia alpina]|uniref:hypothetical protein n=1 Tax=Candidatus Frankia alpina TaxID=2699483 RepID=UPI001967E903
IYDPGDLIRISHGEFRKNSVACRATSRIPDIDVPIGFRRRCRSVVVARFPGWVGRRRRGEATRESPARSRKDMAACSEGLRLAAR